MRAVTIAVLAVIAATTVAGFPRLSRMNVHANLVASGSNKTACLGNITAALGDLNQAKDQIIDSIKDCEAATHNNGTWEKCAEHVSDIAAELADTAINVAEAVPACGGPGSVCADSIIAIGHELSKVSDDVFHAITDCSPGGNGGKCTLRVVMIAEELGHIIGSIEAAVKDCKSSTATAQALRSSSSPRRVKKTTIRVGSSTASSCIGNVTAALGALNGAKDQLGDSITDCKAAAAGNGTWEKCAEHVSDIAADLADTAKDIALAVPACGGPGSLCADQIVAIAHELTKTSDDVFHAITDCTTTGDKSKCTLRIVMIAEEIESIVKSIEGAVKDCKKQ